MTCLFLVKCYKINREQNVRTVTNYNSLLARYKETNLVKSIQQTIIKTRALIWLKTYEVIKNLSVLLLKVNFRI